VGHGTFYPRVEMGKKGIQLTVGLLIIAGGLVTLAGVSFRQNLVYYLSVGEFLDSRGELPPQGFRVNGRVVPDSIVRSPEGLGVTFAITDGKDTMSVAYARELPDTFKSGAEVVVEGTVDDDGTFQARFLLAKCPSKYEKEGEEHPGEVPVESAANDAGTL
jgi:cytochrome c-type biogenesis protein CcmE